MTKNDLNQNGKCVQELIDTLEPNFMFANKAINRVKIIGTNIDNSNQYKTNQKYSYFKFKKIKLSI